MEPDYLLCSRNARPEKDEEGATRRPLCSQNAHDETVLVRCAQSRATLATPRVKGSKNFKGLVRQPQSKASRALA